MKLEVMEWDLEGAAFKDGTVVEFAYVVGRVRRLADGDSPAGSPFEVKVPFASVDPSTRSLLMSSFQVAEAAFASALEAHVSASASDASSLDAKIAAADVAAKDLAERQKRISELDAEIEKRQAALSAIAEREKK